MLDIDLDISEGEWFQFFGSTIDPKTGEVIYEDPASDARVKIRSMAPFIEERIAGRKKTVEHVFNPKLRAMERISFYPDLSPEETVKEREDAWDYAIMEFENFKDRKTGQVIPCTRENKIRLMRNPAFDRFVGRCLQILLDASLKAKGDAEKN